MEPTANGTLNEYVSLQANLETLREVSNRLDKSIDGLTQAKEKSRGLVERLFGRTKVEKTEIPKEVMNDFEALKAGYDSVKDLWHKGSQINEALHYLGLKLELYREVLGYARPENTQ